MRNLENTIGVAFLGGVLNNKMMSFFFEHEEAMNFHLDVDSTNILLNEEERNILPYDVLVLLQDSLTVSIHTVYFVETNKACSRLFPI